MQVEKKRIVVVGSINMDLVARTDRIPAEGETITGSKFETHPGGKGANQAVAAARLGCSVSMVGRVGDDAFGRTLRDGLEAFGVDVAAVNISAGSSGIAVIIVANSGENCIVVTPGANDMVTPADLDANLDLIRSAAVVLTQLELPIETVQYLGEICAREGVPLILDPAPARSLPEGLMQHVRWFTPNETEAAYFLGPAASSIDTPATTASKFLNEGAAGVILKLGSRGVYLQAGDDGGKILPAFTVRTVDTTAAGDAFNGAFAAGLSMGKDAIESARFAMAAAAISVTRPGAQHSMPDIDEVEQLLEAQKL